MARGPYKAQNRGTSWSAYKAQPRVAKWVCGHCGRVPVNEKDRDEGTPRFTVQDFKTKARLDQHVRVQHRI